jgi:hypothetical protein
MGILQQLPAYDDQRRLPAMIKRTLTLTLSLAAGLLGGTLSRYVNPTTMFAQAQSTAPKEIRAQRFTLVDENGKVRGVFAIENLPPVNVVDMEKGAGNAVTKQVEIKGAGEAVIKLFDPSGQEIFIAGSPSMRSLSQR